MKSADIRKWQCGLRNWTSCLSDEVKRIQERMIPSVLQVALFSMQLTFMSFLWGKENTITRENDTECFASGSVLHLTLWILGTARTFFGSLQVSLQFGTVHLSTNQDPTIKKYFIWHYLKKSLFGKNVLHMQHTLHIQYMYVAYVTYMCCICNVYVLHMQRTCIA